MKINDISYSILDVGADIGQPCIEIELWCPESSRDGIDMNAASVCSRIVELSCGHKLTLKFSSVNGEHLNMSAIHDIVVECANRYIEIDTVYVDSPFEYVWEVNLHLFKKIKLVFSGCVTINDQLDLPLLSYILEHLSRFGKVNIVVFIDRIAVNSIQELDKLINENRSCNIYLYSYGLVNDYIQLAIQKGIKVL